jgi:DNA polymerase elongation subunit (family B)
MKQIWSDKEISFVIKHYKKGYSRREIAKIFNNKFPLSKRTPNSIKHCLDTHANSIETDPPKVLVLDIETAPLLSYHWGLFDQNIPLNMMQRDWFVLSWTAKWLHEDKVMYKDQRTKKGKALANDKQLLKPLWKLMDEADIVLGQNSTAFDLKKLNAKFLENGLGVPSEYKKIDTYRLAKKHFSFTSCKLEYMSKKFNKKYKKQDHEEFSGFRLWDECLKGNLKAWKSMERYNNFDVLATEELFLTLAKFDKTELVTSAVRAYEAARKGK